MPSIFIKKIAIENYRSFGQRQIFDFPNEDYKRPIAILGYNNAGKSNLLNAIKYGLYESVREETFTLNDFHNISWNNSPNFKLRFAAEINDSHILFGNDYDNEVIVNVVNNNITSVKDTCNCYNGATHYSKKWVIKQKAPIYYINFHNIKEEISTQKTSWGNLKSFLAKHIQKLVDIDQTMKAKKQAFEQEVDNAKNTVLQNSQLQSFIEAIQKNYQQNLRDNTCQVDFSLPHYEDIFLKMMFKVGLNGDVQNLIPIDHFGDGFISMFVMAVIQAIAETNIEDRCLFLFEEPESFLHENHQEYFYKMVLCSLAEKGHQVIYTTHSDRMIDAFNTRGIIRLETDENNQSVKKYNNVGDFSFEGVVDVDTGEVINYSRYNEFVKTIEPNLNRILFSKKVILVEGPNDVLVYKHSIYKKVLEYFQNDVTIINKEKHADTFLNFENISIVCHHGKTTALYLIELCKHFNIDYFVINDWDFEAVELTIESLNQLNSLDELKQSDLYIGSERKAMLTNNWNLINHAKEKNIHFNIRKLETVIGYNKNDKSSLGIWEVLNSNEFEVSDKLFPEKLMKFIGLN
ncbi:putative ATP-dependent endonuclease of OLD family [Flavobacterium sp. 7E]|uniref:ATP-dependent nuclease n=1 Tax=Flavobacterium sp. 7E TaxID=2735898 RepID=UPI00156E3E1A|nr:AAA family ATPase [Flavobacterium sp. 7E]NRS89054.1 putative ATP-dependent endonuclease of OLD family [Flavobacterium sp. 7E]